MLEAAAAKKQSTCLTELKISVSVQKANKPEKNLELPRERSNVLLSKSRITISSNVEIGGHQTLQMAWVLPGTQNGDLICLSSVSTSRYVHRSVWPDLLGLCSLSLGIITQRKDGTDDGRPCGFRKGYVRSS